MYVLGAETVALADTCNAAFIIQHDLKHVRGISLKIKILTDSAKLFNFMIRNAATT